MQKRVRRWPLIIAVLLLLCGSIALWRHDQRDRLRTQHRSLAANLAVVALEQAVSATETVLRDPEGMRLAAITPDSVTLTSDGARLEVLPYGTLLYHPLASPGSVALDEPFVPGEELERRDPRRAAAWFAGLAKDAPAPVQAGALIRAARALEKSAQPDAALAAYAAAARLATTAIGEVPTELVARAERCRLLARLLRTTERRAEALELRELLLNGRWRITRAVFEENLAAASAWAGAAEPPSRDRLALSAAVEELWPSIRRGPRVEAAPPDEWRGRRFTITALGLPLTVLVQTRARRTNALVAGPWYVRESWTEKLSALERRYRVRIQLRPAAEATAGPDETRRTAAETGLPWTVSVTNIPDSVPNVPRKNNNGGA